jgi:hypothetical protein
MLGAKEALDKKRNHVSRTPFRLSYSRALANFTRSMQIEKSIQQGIGAAKATGDENRFVGRSPSTEPLADASLTGNEWSSHVSGS